MLTKTKEFDILRLNKFFLESLKEFVSFNKMVWLNFGGFFPGVGR